LQRAIGEPWLWSIRPESLNSFLSKHGWREEVTHMRGGGYYGVEYFALAVKRCDSFLTNTPA